MALSRVKVWGTEVLTAADLNAEFDNILGNASSLISPLGGALDWDGYAHTLDAAGVTTAQSTASIAWTLTPGNKTGTPSTTGGITNYAASTWTDNNTAGSGTAASWVGHAFQRPTLAASNTGVTTTNAATVYIPNAPLAGSNQTLTNPWALWIDAGNVRFDDNIYWLSGTSFWGIFDHANAANRTYTFPDADGNVPTVASQAEVTAMTSTTTAISPNANKVILTSVTNTTSGTSVDSPTFPAGVRRIIGQLSGVSTNGTSDFIIQIGDSGGIEATGYLGTAASVASGPSIGIGTPTTYFGLANGVAAAGVYHGHFILQLMDATNFTWSYSSQLGATSTTATHYFGAGVKSLSAELTSVRLSTAGGANTFDAGSIAWSYER